MIPNTLTLTKNLQVDRKLCSSRQKWELRIWQRTEILTVFVQRWGMRKKWWTSPYHNLTFLKVAWYKTWKGICWGHCLAGRCRKEADNWWRPSPYHNFTFLNSAWYKTCRWIGWGHRLAGRCRKEADNWWRSENENCEHNSDRRLAKNMQASNLDKNSSSWQKVVQFPPEIIP